MTRDSNCHGRFDRESSLLDGRGTLALDCVNEVLGEGERADVRLNDRNLVDS